jgi:hypothetical protein
MSDEQAGNILTSLEGLGIALQPVTWQQMLPLALRFDRSAHDAAYRSMFAQWLSEREDGRELVDQYLDPEP